MWDCHGKGELNNKKTVFTRNLDVSEEETS